MKEEEERARQERIRQRAYRLWEAEGRPEGRSDVHWDQATELVAIEENMGLATMSVPDSMANIGPSGEPVEPAEVMQNLGEFPTLRDQGEEETSPHAPEPDPNAPADRPTVGLDMNTGETVEAAAPKPSRAKGDKRDAAAAPNRQAAGAARTAGRASTGNTGPASKPSAKSAAGKADAGKAASAAKGKETTGRTSR